MFKVIEKKAWRDNELWNEFMVYAVQNNRAGYPQILIYDSMWKWKNAKNFIPVEEEEEE